MEPEGRYTIIGTLVLLLAAVTVFALVWLGGYSRVDQHFFTIYFERQSLRGIQVGGEVNVRGLKVGQVTGYSISPDNVNRVKVEIRIDGHSPVSEDTTAVISRNLVTSVARIDLETPNPPGPVLRSVPSGESHPVIPEGSSEFDAISDAVNQIAVTGEEALRNLNEMLNEDNRKAVGETVDSLRNLMNGLSSRLAALDDATVSLTRTAESIQLAGNRIASSIEQTSRQLNRSLVPLTADASATMRDLRGLFEDSRKALGDLAGTTGRLEQSTGQVLERTAQAADIGLLEFRAMARDLRTVVDGLNRTLDKLADPRTTLLGAGEGQLGPGER